MLKTIFGQYGKKHNHRIFYNLKVLSKQFYNHFSFHENVGKDIYIGIYQEENN